MESKLTAVASKVFENGMIFVYESGGVYWLATRVEDKFRTMRSIGFDGAGYREMVKEIKRVAAEY